MLIRATEEERETAACIMSIVKKRFTSKTISEKMGWNSESYPSFISRKIVRKRDGKPIAPHHAILSVLRKEKEILEWANEGTEK